MNDIVYLSSEEPYLLRPQPKNLDIKKQQAAPEVAEKMTKRTPLYTPNKAPANNEKNIVPGIMKVCMNIYTAT